MIKEKFKKPKDIKLDKFIKKFEKESGLTLTATSNTTQLNGFTKTYEENGEVIIEIYLYTESEPSNYIEGVYRNKPFNQGHENDFIVADGDLKGLVIKTKEKTGVL
jgi:hypothetical protein